MRPPLEHRTWTPDRLRYRLVGTAPLRIKSAAGSHREGVKRRVTPFQDFKRTLYVMDEKKVPKKELEPGETWPYAKGAFGFPGWAIRQSILKMGALAAWARRDLQVGMLLEPEAVPLVYKKVLFRCDQCVVKGRDGFQVCGEFHGWSMEIDILKHPSKLSESTIEAALASAGSESGIGFHRAEQGGGCGTFRIERKRVR